ncbi:MAG: DUF3990 domain-containing protein [Treponema sp.]|jgi:hypothetical protein|nr:DUF3990 domain-containing protein [Treponema sp.]
METKLILYHGSNQNFDAVDLSKSKDKRDFGRGFYTTTLREQAQDWAEALFDRYKGNGIFVYEMELDITNDLLVKSYEGLSEEWLLMVQKNRTLGGLQHKFDIVQGPVANDKTARTIALYIAGIIDVNEALQRLKFNQVNNQVSLHTPSALSHLTLLRKYANER